MKANFWVPHYSKVEEDKAAGKTTNVGCISHATNKDGGIDWHRMPGNSYVVPGQCLCNNWLLNEVADTVLEAMPMIAQVGTVCLYIYAGANKSINRSAVTYSCPL